MDGSRGGSRTIWSDILTAAVNLPPSTPRKEDILRALVAAQQVAAASVPAMFSEQWYTRALASIRAEDKDVRDWIAREQVRALRHAMEDFSQRA